MNNQVDAIFPETIQFDKQVELKRHLKILTPRGSHHSSVVLFTPTILRHHRFESQAHHQQFFQFVLLKLWWEKDKNKQKEAGIGPFKNAGNITKNGGNLGPEGMKGNLS